MERSPAADTLDEPLDLDGAADTGMEQQPEEDVQDPTAKPVEGGKQQHPPPPLASWSPRLDVAWAFLSDHALEEEATKLADLRLQIQASKLAFVVEKRRKALVELGFTLRREEAAVGPTANTIQEFLDRTWAGRHVSRQGFSPLDSGDIECPVPFGYKRDGIDSVKISVLRKQCSAKFGSDRHGAGRGRGSRGAGGVAMVQAKGSGGGGGDGGGGNAEDFFRSSCGFELWRDMTFVFCEELGWVFLHQATKQAASVVKDLFRSDNDVDLHAAELLAWVEAGHPRPIFYELDGNRNDGRRVDD